MIVGKRQRFDNGKIEKHDFSAMASRDRLSYAVPPTIAGHFWRVSIGLAKRKIQDTIGEVRLRPVIGREQKGFSETAPAYLAVKN